MAKHSGASKWTFLTNHGHVLLCLAQSSGLRLRDVAAQVGVTERAVQRIVADLENGGYLRRRRSGRQNVYEIDFEQPLRHPVESHHRVGELIALSVEEEPRAPRRRPARAGAKRATGR
ncbi:MAG: winged helix-turn-helix transcriptional regulator [Acidobacteria bacterium]|nr:winged helix-turn-helix transcriptional regulator [Acidobacteriota bacterium]